MFYFSCSTDPYYGPCCRKTPMENSREELVVQQREWSSTRRRFFIHFVCESDSGQRVVETVDDSLLASRSSSEPKCNLGLRAMDTRWQPYRQRGKPGFNPCVPSRCGNCPNRTYVRQNSTITAPIFAPSFSLQVALPCKRNSRPLHLWSFLTAVRRRGRQRIVFNQRGRL